MKCQDSLSLKTEKKIKIAIYYKFRLALYGLNVFTTYDNIKALFGVLCLAKVSFIHDTREFTVIVARSKLIDSKFKLILKVLSKNL